ncbi:hypothetical protein SeLEV6574_g01944 [Synchytrium endobioticum]|uniref:Uncharacterized protein n=1 Tax=Synchytrium endobioticum TaxID=286115 RepID=A0A507DCL7_9FUNG|nr:hypothetical protein SeLEV6574_g01944 [Synchytrium endobioticum]
MNAARQSLQRKGDVLLGLKRSLLVAHMTMTPELPHISIEIVRAFLSSSPFMRGLTHCTHIPLTLLDEMAVVDTLISSYIVDAFSSPWSTYQYRE